MAGSRALSNNQRRLESSLNEPDSAAASTQEPRGVLPVVHSTATSRRVVPPPRKRTRSRSPRGDHRHNKHQRRRSRSRTPSSARHLHKPSLTARQERPPPFERQHDTARSDERFPIRDQHIDRSRSPERSSPGRRPGRPSASGWEPGRQHRHSPARQSTDTYFPSTDRRHRPAPASTYRPNEIKDRRRSITPPRQHRPKREFSPQGHPRRRSSRSPAEKFRGRRSPPARARREADTYIPSGSRPRRSPSPRSRRSPARTSADHSPRGEGSFGPPSRRSPSPYDKRRRANRPNGDSKMRPTYYHGGRGGSRPPPNNYPGSPQHYIAPPPPAHHAQSPSYGPGRDWHVQSPYQGSHGGSPYAPPPFHHDNYPPIPQPSPGYFGAPSPGPAPQYYGGSPPYPPQMYPPPMDRRNMPDQHSPPQAARDPYAKKRGHFSNLSWTPTTGSRGGVTGQAKPAPAPTEKKRFKEKRRDSDRGERPDEMERGDKSRVEEEEDDDPFRPSKHLRAEDESSKAKEPARPVPTKAQLEADNKFKFAFKSKSTTGTNPVSAFEKKPGVRREKRLVKRLKMPPVVPPEYASSDSVYFRKPGNESVVGSGTYGKVFRAVHVYTGEKVALKKIRMEGERDGFPVTAIREVKLLQSLNHDNIVRLQEVMVEKNDCYMVFEYLSHDLTGLLNHPHFRLEPFHKKHLARQLFEGLDYLHRRGVLHRDIKAANILISNTGQLKLADFGLARFFAKRRQLDYTNRVITIWYRSPELLLGETQYGPAVDIWSASCVLVEIFTKHAIFPGDGGEINQLDKIYGVLGTPTRTEWPGIIDMAWFELLRPTERKPSTFEERYRERVTPAAFELLTWMFQYDPVKRPSAQQVLEHAYFRTEEPEAKRVFELKELEGDWHEFESKALRKEKERVEREARKEKEREARHRERDRELEAREKRKALEADLAGEGDAKRPKVEGEVAGGAAVAATAGR